MDPLQRKPKQQELPFGEQPNEEEATTTEPPPGIGTDEEDSPERADEYEEKLDLRRERLEAAAARARASSDAHFQRSHEAVQHIPLGQPILRGHHSERRHRRDIERSDRAMARSVAEARKAEQLEHRASRVGKGGISSDDPEATKKLQENLQELEELRETMKRVNREFRKGGWEAVTGLSEAAKKKLGADMARMPFQGSSPYPSYALRNLGANIRRIQARIQELTTAAAEPEKEVVCGEGFTLGESKADNRIRFIFEGKPAAATRTLLKREGFRWSRSAGAWQRKITTAGWAAAERIRLSLDGSADGETEKPDAAPQVQDAALPWVREHGRNDVIARIRRGLNNRSDRSWSVTGGRGTSYGWLQIDAPPQRRTFDHRPTDERGGDGLPVFELVDAGSDGYLMGRDDRIELARLLGFPDESAVPHQGVKVPSGHDYYAEFIDRAEGRPPSTRGEPYWD